MRCAHPAARCRTAGCRRQTALERPGAAPGGSSTADWIAGPDLAARDDDAHDARLADGFAEFALPHRRHQARMDAVELGTRRAQPGHFDGCRLAEGRSRAPSGSPSRSDAARGDVLADARRATGQSRPPPQLIVQLGVDQMHLAEVRPIRALAGRGSGAGAATPMCTVALDAQPRERPDVSPSFGFVIVCVALRLTAVTLASMPAASPALPRQPWPLRAGALHLVDRLGRAGGEDLVAAGGDEDVVLDAHADAAELRRHGMRRPSGAFAFSSSSIFFAAATPIR